jgi:hypothetical protein
LFLEKEWRLGDLVGFYDRVCKKSGVVPLLLENDKVTTVL